MPVGTLRAALALLLMLGLGCGSCGSRATEETREEAAPEPAARLGTLRGVVRLAEGTEPPLYPSALIHGRESAGTWPEVCAPPKTGDRRPTPVGEDRVLGNVALTVTTASEHRAAFMAALGIVDGVHPGREPVEHVVTIEDCRMEPAFLTATKGDTLTIANATDYPYFPRFGRSPFQQSMNLGERRSNPLERGGNLSLDCGGFGAACGRADVVVMFHSAHGTSAADGSFAVEVPADMPLVLHGWHPALRGDASRGDRPGGGRGHRRGRHAAGAPAPRAGAAPRSHGGPPGRRAGALLTAAQLSASSKAPLFARPLWGFEKPSCSAAATPNVDSFPRAGSGSRPSASR